MAGKKTSGSKKKRSASGRKPKRAKGKDVVRTPNFMKDVRVPLNAADAARKERRIREHLDVIAEAEEAMKPHKKTVRDSKKEIEKLRKDVGSNSEEVEREVYALKDYKRNNIQICLVDTDEVVEDRTMTPDERQTNLEDGPAGGRGDDASSGGETAGEGGAEGESEEGEDGEEGDDTVH
jgi:hypothetical protein